MDKDSMLEKWAEDPGLAKEALKAAEAVGPDFVAMTMDAIYRTIKIIRDQVGVEAVTVLIGLRKPDRDYVEQNEFRIGVIKELIELLNTPTEGHAEAKEKLKQWATEIGREWQECKDSLNVEQWN